MHLAEILATAARRVTRAGEPRAELREPTPTFAGTPTVPGGRQGRPRRRPARANLGRPRRSARSGPGPWRGRRLGRRCAWPARRSRTRSCPPAGAARPAGGQRAGGRRRRPLGPRRRRGQPIVVDIVRTARRPRGRQGQVDGHPGDRAQRGPRRRGHRRLETDLAELIVQLGHDLPSHILVPAIHRNRTEIREIFEREMAQPTPRAGRPHRRPARAAEAARLHLREKFLRARVAISGANFAIAETGTCGRRVRGQRTDVPTLPETLITVMGIEKVLPTWEDLEVSCSCCRARHRRADEPLHLAVDRGHAGDGRRSSTSCCSTPGGRRAVRRGRAAGARCIRCSACLNVCPVHERTGGHAYGSVYPGPIGAILTPQLAGLARDATDAALRLDAVRRLLRGLPGPDRHPEVLVHLRGQVVEPAGAPTDRG